MHKYTEEQESWIKAHYKGISTNELTERFNQRFGTNLASTSIRAYKKNRRMRSGYDARFYKGQPAHNKGQHVIYPGSEKGWFKKGNIPHNHVPVGSISHTTGDRYIVRKIAEPNKWEFEHKLIWTRANGEIPKGMILIFLDGDHENVTLENLALISKSENQAMNRKRLRSNLAEITKAGVTLVRLEKAINNRRREE